MGKPMIGECALCLQQKQLKKSHFLGRALHLLSEANGEAVLMTPARMKLSARQFWAHLLCAACEALLGANESYALEWLNRGDRFGLLQRMNLALPMRRTLHGVEFSGADIGVSTAISLFRGQYILAGERTQMENAGPANDLHRSRRARRTHQALPEGRGTIPNGSRIAYDRLH